MRTLISVGKAKEEIEWLNAYVNMVENYQADTIEKLIIKEYAHLTSSKKVADKLNSRGLTINNQKILPIDVITVVRSTAKDDLHKIIKRGLAYKMRKRH